MRDRSDDLSYHELTLYHWSYVLNHLKGQGVRCGSEYLVLNGVRLTNVVESCDINNKFLILKHWNTHLQQLYSMDIGFVPLYISVRRSCTGRLYPISNRNAIPHLQPDQYTPYPTRPLYPISYGTTIPHLQMDHYTPSPTGPLYPISNQTTIPHL